MGKDTKPRKGYGKPVKVIYGQVPNLPADGYRRKKPEDMDEKKWIEEEQLRKTKKYTEDNKKGETGGGTEKNLPRKPKYGLPRKPRWG